jgi:flavin-dependent dehydrogenase
VSLAALVILYVGLLEEGADCWRAVAAEDLGAGLYRLVGAVPEGEVWEYQPGEVVNAREMVFADGERGLVATRVGGA